MQGIYKKRRQIFKLKGCINLIAFSAVFAIFAGCATQMKTEPAAEMQPKSTSVGATVSRLEDGREGFIITEVADIDIASHQNFEIAVTLLDEEAYQQAIEILEKVVDQSPGVTAPYINLGIAYQQIGKLEEAEDKFKVALNLIPDHPVACNQYGLLLRKTGRFDGAREIYEKALERFPQYFPLHRNLGILYDLYLNNLESALTHYEIYRQAMPEDDKVKLWIADLRARMGDK